MRLTTLGPLGNSQKFDVTLKSDSVHRQHITKNCTNQIGAQNVLLGHITSFISKN